MASTDTTVPTVTVPCELGRHPACKGRIVSLVAPAGTSCACDCHTPEADHGGKVA